MPLEERGSVSSLPVWRRISNWLIPVRAVLPTTEAGDQLFATDEPGAVEVIQDGAVLGDANPLPMETIHAGAAVAEGRLRRKRDTTGQ